MTGRAAGPAQPTVVGQLAASHDAVVAQKWQTSKHRNANLLHVTSTEMVHAGTAKNLVSIVGTAQSTSHLTEPTRAGETPAGCRPRARGVFTPPLVIMCILSAIVKEGNDMS